MMDVGVVGLGRMGSAIARRLIDAGHRVTVFNRTRSRAEPFREAAAAVAASPAQAASGDVVVTMLANDQAVEATVLGNDGVLQGLRPDGVHVSASTITVSMSERLAEEHRRAGRSYLAAPVFGRPEAAASGKLFVVCGGEADAIERCRPVFDAIGQRTFVIGTAPQSASLVKLGGNFLIAATIECLGEAVALMRKSGVDPHAFIEVMTGSLFDAPVFRTYGKLILEQQFEPPGFAMPLGLKDITSTLAAAEAEAGADAGGQPSARPLYRRHCPRRRDA
jgi:3-hydroxyisobutyrate dehydrogenase-like beta-hydroxyacid dehydrogenase